MRFILCILTIVLIGLASCDRECACLDPENCSHCQEHGCDCECCTPSPSLHLLLVQAVLPDGAEAASYTLNYSSNVRKFWGNMVTIYATSDCLDLLMFNNDGKNTVLTDDGIATTSQMVGSDEIYYQPTPLYSLYQPDTYVLDADTIKMSLEPRVYDYDIEVVFENNDGRVQTVTGLVLSGMAKTLDLKTLTLSDEASYYTNVEMEDNVATGLVQSFGPGELEQILTIQFKRENGSTDTYDVDVTDITQPLTTGGLIRVVIDVENSIPATTTVGSGINVTLEDRESAEDVTINRSLKHS